MRQSLCSAGSLPASRRDCKLNITIFREILSWNSSNTNTRNQSKKSWRGKKAFSTDLHHLFNAFGERQRSEVFYLDSALWLKKFQKAPGTSCGRPATPSAQPVGGPLPWRARHRSWGRLSARCESTHTSRTADPPRIYRQSEKGHKEGDLDLKHPASSKRAETHKTWAAEKHLEVWANCPDLLSQSFKIFLRISSVVCSWWRPSLA